ncbi:SafA/ExsA family spore coat assembly protein [Neobacillus sp. YIM B06451]|uniref:SafA/ExsA family spore coat assembly protein n=1 Tax=Neobacillus sp. YIM B06451 TaxID=3070994 RepID=UPI00293093E3|nr:SafA/ExsA family spore coat assembly protein [Neobacillus sp. YIM B06451]
MKKALLILLVFVMAIVAVPSISSAQTIHTVVRGDTLWKISVRYHVGLHELIRANPQFKNPDLIYPGQKVTIPKIGAKSVEQQVISLTNQERAKHGLKALAHDWELSRVARYKSVDMRNKNYFSHTSPTYGSPFTMMKNFGIAYRSAGENIAAGQTTAAEVVRAWMNSPGHRKNILSRDYTHIGVGYAAGGSQRHYWTQMFISK